MADDDDYKPTAAELRIIARSQGEEVPPPKSTREPSDSEKRIRASHRRAEAEKPGRNVRGNTDASKRRWRDR